MNPFRDYRKLRVTAIGAPLAEVVEFTRDTINAAYAPKPPEDRQRIETKKVDLDFSLAYIDEPKGGADPLRAIFWAPKGSPNSTALMCNYPDGMQTTILFLSESSPYTWAHACIGDANEFAFPGCQFFVYSNYNSSSRWIAAQVEDAGRWEYYQSGSPLPFEKPEYGQRRRIRDRLNRAIVAEYMLAMGYDICSEDFWQTDELARFVWQIRPSASDASPVRSGE